MKKQLFLYGGLLLIAFQIYKYVRYGFLHHAAVNSNGSPYSTGYSIGYFVGYNFCLVAGLVLLIIAFKTKKATT